MDFQDLEQIAGTGIALPPPNHGQKEDVRNLWEEEARKAGYSS